MAITSSTNMCNVCESDEIMSVCEEITPFNQINITQCLRCLCDIVDNRPCPCKACDQYDVPEENSFVMIVIMALFCILKNVYTVNQRNRKVFV